MPDIDMPDIDMPDIDMPDIDMPDIEIGELAIRIDGGARFHQARLAAAVREQLPIAVREHDAVEALVARIVSEVRAARPRGAR